MPGEAPLPEGAAAPVPHPLPASLHRPQAPLSRPVLPTASSLAARKPPLPIPPPVTRGQAHTGRWPDRRALALAAPQLWTISSPQAMTAHTQGTPLSPVKITATVTSPSLASGENVSQFPTMVYQHSLTGESASSTPLISSCTDSERLVRGDSNMVERSASRAGEHLRSSRYSSNRSRGAVSTSTSSGERGRSRGRRPRGGRLPRGSTGDRAERSRSSNRAPRQPQKRGRGRGRPSKRQTASVAPWDRARDNPPHFTAGEKTSPSGFLQTLPGEDKMHASAGDQVATSRGFSPHMPIYEDISDPEEDTTALPKPKVINGSVLMCNQRYSLGKSHESTSKDEDSRLFNNNKTNVSEHGQLFKIVLNEEFTDPVEVQLKKIFDSPLHSPEPCSSVTHSSKSGSISDSTSEPCVHIHESLTESSMVSKEHQTDAENIHKEKPLSLRIKITKKNNHCDYSISECDSGHHSEINSSNIDVLDTSDNPLQNVVISNVEHIPVDKFRNLSEVDHPSFIAENEVDAQEIGNEAHPESKINEEGTLRAIDETVKLDKFTNVEPKNKNESLMDYEVEGEEEDDDFEDDIGCLRIDEDNSSDENESIPKNIPEQSTADCNSSNCVSSVKDGKNISNTLSTLRNVTSPISAMSIVQPHLSKSQHVEQITQSSQDKVILSQNAEDKINDVNVSSHRHKDSVSASVENVRSIKLTSAMLVEKSGSLIYGEQTEDETYVVSKESSPIKKSVYTDNINIGTLPKNSDHYDTAKTFKVGKRKIAHPESQTASWRYPKKMTSSDIESTICAVGSSEESLPTCGKASRVQGKPDNNCDVGSENDSSTVGTQGNAKRRKKNSDHTSVEEIFHQPICSQLGEKGKRLAQEIPGFNWLENKIRNGVTTKPLPKHSHPDKSKPATLSLTKSDNIKTQVTGSNAKVSFQNGLQENIQGQSPVKNTNSLTTVICAQQNRVPVIVSTRGLENVDSKLRELANVGDLEITIPEKLTPINQLNGLQGKANSNNKISELFGVHNHSGRTVEEMGVQQSSQAAPTTTSSPSIYTYPTPTFTTTHSLPTIISPVNVSLGLQAVNPPQMSSEVSKNVMEHGPSTPVVSSLNKPQHIEVSAKAAKQEGNVSQSSEKNSKQKPTGSLPPTTSQSSAINEVVGYHQMQIVPQSSRNHYGPVPPPPHTVQQPFDQPIFPESCGFNISSYSHRQPPPPPATSLPTQHSVISAQKQQFSTLPLRSQPPPTSQMPLVSHPSSSVSLENISSHPSSHFIQNHFFPASHPHPSLQQTSPHHYLSRQRLSSQELAKPSQQIVPHNFPHVSIQNQVTPQTVAMSQAFQTQSNLMFPFPFRPEHPYLGSNYSTQLPTQAEDCQAVVSLQQNQTYCPQYPAPIPRNILCDSYHQNIAPQIPPQPPPHHPHSLAPSLPHPSNPSFQVRQPSQQNPQQSTQILDLNAPVYPKQIGPLANCTSAQTYLGNKLLQTGNRSYGSHPVNSQMVNGTEIVHPNQINFSMAQAMASNSNMHFQLQQQSGRNSSTQSRNNGSRESNRQTNMEKMEKTSMLPWQRPPQMQQHLNPSIYSHLQAIHPPSSTSHSNESPCSSQSASLMPYSLNHNLSERLDTMTSNVASSFDSGLRVAFQLPEGHNTEDYRGNPKQPTRTSRFLYNAASTNGLKGNECTNGLSRYGSNQLTSDCGNNNTQYNRSCSRISEDSHTAVSSSSNKSPNSVLIHTANQSSTPHETGNETDVNNAEREAKSGKDGSSEVDEIAVLEKVKEQTIGHLLKIPGSLNRMKKVYTEKFVKLLMEGTCSIVGDNLIINVNNDNHVVPLVDVIKIFYPSSRVLPSICTHPPTERSEVHVTTSAASEDGPLDLSVGVKIQPRNESPASTSALVPSQSSDSVFAVSESQEKTPEQHQSRQRANEKASYQSQNTNLRTLLTNASPNVSSNDTSKAGFNVVEERYDSGEVGDEFFRDPNNCCIRCFKKAKFVCSVCQATKYCSKNCQDEHWSEHKQNCAAV